MWSDLDTVGLRPIAIEGHRMQYNCPMDYQLPVLDGAGSA